MKTISIVAPNGTRIADGIKTIEVRSWTPDLNPDEDLLIVENKRYLKVEGEVDPEGYAVAVVCVAKVRTFEEQDIPAACATSFAEGYYSWELTHVRKLQNPLLVSAKRGLYETDFSTKEFDNPILDSHYVNPKLAQLYDLDSGWNKEREFYLSLAGESRKCVLDLGCGTGLICDALAAKGHDVTGVDPSMTMLEVARQKPNGSKVEWIHSTAQDFKSDKFFDLIIMTGNAFQVLLDEKDLQTVCRVMQKHLRPDGLIAFESRNPNLDWASRWNYEIKLNAPVGEVIESRHFLSWSGRRMSFELRYQFPDEKLISHSQLRFWSAKEIERHLSEAGLRIERLMGDWEFGDFKENSTEEMVFIARHPEIKFVAVEEEHISVLRKWLKEPHVAEFWQETDDEEKFREKFLNKLQDRGVSPFIIYIGRKPVGYIQSYEAKKVGGGWWPNAEPGTFGIDQFIGEPDFINRSWGTKIINQFVEDLFQSESVKEIITDPEPKNTRAIRCYEKVGFVRVGEIETPSGEATLMRLTR